MSGATRRILLIHNPAAGRRQALQPVLDALVRYDVAVALQATGQRGDAERLAREAAVSGDYDIVVAAGGDGTINEVANGLLGSDLPLAIIPLGTANVLAIELGLSKAPEKIAEAIVTGRAEPVWPGLANGRAFLLMAGVGFDAAVVNSVTTQLKRRLGKLAYVWQAIRLWWHGDSRHYHVMVDGVAHQAASAVVARSRHYGGRWICAHEARLDDPGLHVVLFERAGRLATLGYAFALGTGRLARWPGVQHLRAQHVEIPAPGPVQIDGDHSDKAMDQLLLSVAAKPLMLVRPPVTSPGG